MYNPNSRALVCPSRNPTLKSLYRKSIPYSCFLESGVEVARSYNPRLKYIDAIDKLYF